MRGKTENMCESKKGDDGFLSFSFLKTIRARGLLKIMRFLFVQAESRW